VNAEEREIPAELSGARLDEVLAALFPSRSKAALQKLVRRGGVELDGRRVLRSNVRPRPRARLRVDLPEARTPVPALELLFEDEHLAVVNKPAGLLTHGNEREASGTLAELVGERLGRLPMLMGEHRPGIVHRLDRDTSGALVVARTAAVMESLREAFRERRVGKEYLALVHGVPEEERFSVDASLGPVDGHPDRQRVRPDGREALTGFELVERLGPLSLLRCTPRTGRRHQIRVHLHHAGLPLVADPIYGPREEAALPAGVARPRRHALHAARLVLDHPARPGEVVDATAPLRAELADLVEALRAARG
jgi:23S rRNA pseudouridine1911/1915/1917 synthase